MNNDLKRDGRQRNYAQTEEAMAGEPLTDEHEARSLEDVNPEENTADEILYGGEENDFDREYWDNPDEHEYYDEPEKTGYHPDDD